MALFLLLLLLVQSPADRDATSLTVADDQIWWIRVVQRIGAGGRGVAGLGSATARTPPRSSTPVFYLLKPTSARGARLAGRVQPQRSLRGMAGE